MLLEECLLIWQKPSVKKAIECLLRDLRTNSNRGKAVNAAADIHKLTVMARKRKKTHDRGVRSSFNPHSKAP